MKLSDIKPNPNNPRIIKDDKFKKLVKSISEFPKMMQLRPMIINNDMIVLGGNMRLKALKELGYKDIPDTWVKNANDITEDEQRRFIIADNVVFGEHDWEILKTEWDIDKLIDWGLDVPKWDILEQQDIKEVDEFNEECNFTIKCKDVAELDELQAKLNCNGKKLSFNDFCIKAGL